MASGLPSGTVTFLFTDIEGSTRLTQQRKDSVASLPDADLELHGERFIRCRLFATGYPAR